MHRMWRWLLENNAQLTVLAGMSTVLLFIIAFFALLYQRQELRNLQAQYEEEKLVDLVFVVDNVENREYLLWANTGKVPVFVHGWALEAPANSQAQPNLSEGVYKGLNPAESDRQEITADIHKLFSQNLHIPLSPGNTLTKPVQEEFAVHTRYFARGQRHERRVPYRFRWSPPNQGQAEQVAPSEDRIVPSIH